MNLDNEYQLNIWKGDWGLPSVDIPCLQVLAYAKFTGVPLSVNPTSNPFRTPRGHLPVLKCGASSFDSIQDIIQLFRKRNYNADFHLSPKQCSEVLSYEYMLKESLYPAFQFIWWVDQRNFSDFIRPWYAKAIPFPLNFYYPSKYEKHARAMIEILFPTEEVMTVIENKIYSEAQKCINLLSTRLGDADYFFGSQPTYLDAVVFSYLAPLLKIPLPNPSLQNHLKACTNLVKFVSRISQRYFEADYQKYEKIKSKENETKLSKDSDSEFPHKTRNQILAGIFATVAMVSYAIYTGIVK
ncbi:metaxin-1 [Fopius arisanus]|uniref:Metaxin n=1 Tax=Fopius arisanus TaxID=64838 RepID=A0A9R1UA36_9HYME|nr:PREDICTED: metaxin-1 [Fopius arisanus]